MNKTPLAYVPDFSTNGAGEPGLADLVSGLQVVESTDPRQRTTSAPASIDDFVRSVAPAAAKVASRLNVPIDAVIGQWALETGWGKSVIPGTNNLGNIKDFSGKGVEAVDNLTKSRDKYRAYDSVEGFADDFAGLLSNKRYSSVPGSKDSSSYFSALKEAGYAEAPNYIEAGVKASQMAANALNKSGFKPQATEAALPDLAKIPKWSQIEGGKKYQSIPPEAQRQLKEKYFDEVLAPHAKNAGADVALERFKFLEQGVAGETQPAGNGKGWGDTAMDVIGSIADPFKDAGNAIAKALKPAGSVMDGVTDTRPELDTASRVPVNPEVRAAFNGQWDAATPEQRTKMQERPDWIGQLARERAGIFDNQSPLAKDAKGLQAVDPRIEARRAELIRKGEDPRFADVAATRGAKLGITPGEEVSTMRTIGESTDPIQRMIAEYEAAPVGEAPQGFVDVTSNAIMRGLKNNSAMVSGLLAAGAKGVGADDLALALLKEYFRASGESKMYPGQIKDFTHINSLDDVPVYAWEGILENAPQLIGSIGSGVVGGMLAKKFGQKAVADMVAEQAAKYIAKKQALGAAMGAGAASVGMETGSIYGDIARETGQERPGVALAFGSVAGALDALPALRAAKTILGDEAVSFAVKEMVKRYGKEALQQLGSEGVTEFLQTFVEKAAVSHVDGKPFLTMENLIEAMDAGIKGGIAGAGVGVTSQGIADYRNRHNLQANAAANEAQARAMEAWANGLGGVRNVPPVPPSATAVQPFATAVPHVPPMTDPSGRIDPTISDPSLSSPAAVPAPAPAPTRQPKHETEAVADAIVAQMAEQVGIPLDVVLPPETTVAPSVPTQDAEAPQQTSQPQQMSDQDVLDFARNRYQQLRVKQNGQIDPESGDIMGGEGLTASEVQELQGLISANKDVTALRNAYGFNEQAAAPEQTPVTPVTPATNDIPAAPPAIPEGYEFADLGGGVMGIRPKQQEVAAPKQEQADDQATVLAQKAVQEFGLKANEYGKAFQAGVRDAAQGKAPARTKGGYVEGHAWALAQMGQEPAKDAAPNQEVDATTEQQAKQAEAKPKTEKEANQAKDYDEKWFGSQKKADEFIAKKKIGDTHHVVQDGQKFLIKRKEAANGTQTNETQQTEAQGTEREQAPGEGAKLGNESAKEEANNDVQTPPDENSYLNAKIFSVFDRIEVDTKHGKRRASLSWALRPDKYKEIYGEEGAIVNIDGGRDFGANGIVYVGPTDIETLRNFVTAYVQEHAKAKQEDAATGAKPKKDSGNNTNAKTEPTDSDGQAKADTLRKRGVVEGNIQQALLEAAEGDNTLIDDLLRISEREEFAPGTRINGEIEKAAADRLEKLYEQMSNITQRNSREGQAKVNLRNAVGALRREKTSISVTNILMTSSDALAKNYGAFSAVIDEVVESLKGENAGIRTEEAAPIAKAEPSQFADNKIFTADKVAAARERLKKKLGTLNSGIDPELLIDGMTIAGAYIESGVKRYSEYTKTMVGDFGEVIRPYLRSFYEAVRNYPGLDVQGMTTPAEIDLLEKEGTAEHIKPAPEAADAVGNTVKRTKERKKTGTATLVNDYGVPHIDGYDNPNEGPSGPVKAQFLKDTKKYLDAVRKALAAAGFEPYTGRNGKPEKAVSVSEGGIAGSGDVSITLFNPELGHGIYITIGESCLRGVVPTTKSGIAVMMRASTQSDRYGTKDTNNWMPVDMTSEELAEAAIAHVERMAKHAQSRLEKPADVTDNADTNDKGISNGNALQDEVVPAGDQASDLQDATAGNNDSQPLDAGVAATGQGSDSVGGISGRSGQSGAEGTGGIKPAGHESSIKLGESGSVRIGSIPAVSERGSGERRRSRGRGTERSGNEPDGNAQVDSRDATGDYVSKDGQQLRGISGDDERQQPGQRGQEELAQDHVINDADEIGKGGLGQKYRDNVAAIRTLKAIEAEGRTKATPEERKILAKYVGWGALKGVFDGDNKQWAKQHAEIKELLTAEEFKAANLSVLDAHYTSTQVVGAMYDALTRLGFKNGRVLEPSVGIGNFFGLMPKDMRNASQLHGVELDSLTSRLVSLLYPKAKIAQATGFEDYAIPSEFFDVVIGNPPFGNTPLVDEERNAYSGSSIHNYFLAKSIDKLRPGGIGMFVVSHNFLDATDGRTRKWIGDRASLIGAVRLPNTAFKENAGTEVVTDILIFQKHDHNGLPNSLAPWQAIESQKNENTKTGETVSHSVNEFFVRNPHLVLGKPSATGSMYGANEYTVEATGDIKEGLAAWVKTLPDHVFNNINRDTDSATTDTAIPDGVKVGSFFVDKNGKVMCRGNDQMGDRTANEWVPRYNSYIDRMKGMIELRELLRNQMRLERLPDATTEAIEANRAKLNTSYDEFVKKFGYVNSTTNRSVFLDDTEAHLIQALEFEYDKGITKAVAEKEGIEQKGPSAKKADIFERRVAFPPSDYMNVHSARDALLASLNYRGRIDSDYMVQVYGKPLEDITAELGDVVFVDPQAGIVTADEYLSGDVKTKLAEAEAAARTDKAYARNVKALKAVIPKDKTPSEIHASLGANFIPAEIYKDFIKHVTGGGADLSYVKTMGQWSIFFANNADPALNRGKFGTEDLSAQALIELTFLGRGAIVKETIKHPDGSSTTYVKEVETEAARNKQNAIKDEWKKWLWQDAERSTLVAGLYNEKMNRTVERKYDGSHLTLPGMTPAITLLPHQKDGVWRGLQTPQVLFDQVVGAGKTFEMATLAMEMRRMGKARKPLFVVPNHLTLQWMNEFTKLFPGANVLAARPEDFSKDNRERLFAKIITQDWDAVIIGHSSLKKIGLPPETERAVLQEQIDELADAIEEMKRNRGDSRIVSDMQKIRRNLEAKMKDKLAAVGKRSDMVTFDELGVDALFIDEMHEFKNLTYHSTMDRNPGMGNPAGSAKAFDLFVKVRWLFNTFGEKTNFVTATGTPVSNSLVEMFNMQRYMQYPTLKEHGLHVFDAWARQFGSVENVYEVAPSGSGYRQATRFAKFTNLGSLMSMYGTFAEVTTLDDLKNQGVARGKPFPVPKVAGGKPTNIVAERSELQAEHMGVPRAEINENGEVVFGIDLNHEVTIVPDGQDKWSIKVDGVSIETGIETEQDAQAKVVQMALTPKVSVDPESILGRFGRLKELTKSTKGRVNALSLTGEANKVGLDYRLVDPSAPDFAGSKINLAVEQMMIQYKKWAADKGTQLVFCDMSVPLSARANYANAERRLYVRDAEGKVDMKRGTLHAHEKYPELPFYVVSRKDGTRKVFDVYDAATGISVSEGYASRNEAVEKTTEDYESLKNRTILIEAREAAGDIGQGEIDEYNNENEVEVENGNAFSLEDVAGVSGTSSFSVYDDIKAKLVARGVPEREIAFIHDYNTPVAKDNLFKAVKRGDARFLLGSTPKMGAGTNVQDRLVGLHHIDAPWRPSDLEQREGRIIRQGNKLYERDPEGFEVFIGRYATSQTYDTRRWQILEHKARGIEQLRTYDGSINEIDDIEGEAANSADMKAAASGDPLILEETRLRNEVKRLENLQSAYADEVYHLGQRINSANRYVSDYGPKYVAEIQSLIDTVEKHPLTKDGFSPITVAGRTYNTKEDAHKAITSAFASVSSLMKTEEKFNYRGLEFKIESEPSFNGSVVRLRSPLGGHGTWGQGEAFSPSGFVQRIKNIVESLDSRLEEGKAEIDAKRKEAKDMAELVGQPFPQAANLEQARNDYKQVQRALMAKGPAVPEEQRQMVDDAIDVQKIRLREIGFNETLDEMAGNDDGPALFDLSGDRGAAVSKAIDRAIAIRRGENVPSVKRESALLKLRKLRRQMEEGKISAEEFIEGAVTLQASLEEVSQARKYAPSNGRERGADYIRERLLQAKRRGDVSAEAVDIAEWFILQNPALLDDLAVSVRAQKESEAGASGRYDPVRRLITLFKGKVDSDTVVHEILHHLERMMPEEMRQAIRKEYAKRLESTLREAEKTGNKEVIKYINALIEFNVSGNEKRMAEAKELLTSGKIPYKLYSLFNQSEFWAVHGAQLARDRYEAGRSVLGRAWQWIREAVNKIAGTLGLRSDAPIIRAMDAMIKRSESNFVSKEMLSDAPLFNSWIEDAGGIEMLEILDTIEVTGSKIQPMTEAEIEQAETRFLSNAPKGTDYPHRTGRLKVLRRASLLAADALGGEPETPRDISGQRLGPFSGYQIRADVLPGDSFNPEGSLQVLVYGNEQIAKGLDADPALTLTVTANGELTINGPKESTDTFREFKKLGWADVAKGANGEPVMGWTALKDPANPDKLLPLSQVMPLLADVHARVREWRNEDYVGLHWSRATGALGGLPGNTESSHSNVFFSLSNPNPVQEIRQKVTERVKNNLIQFFGNRHDPSSRTMNLWDRYLGTQYHKALKSKHFGKVFHIANAMQNHVSLAGIRPAELAPAILHKVDDFWSAAKQTVMGRQSISDMDKVSAMLINGTLAGKGVLDGKVWTDEELSDAGISEQGRAVYHQARAAIDASIDELAAAEGYAMAQMVIGKSYRQAVINRPDQAPRIIGEALKKQSDALGRAIAAAEAKGNEEQAEALKAGKEALDKTIENVTKVFVTAQNLKAAGYMPLMRFGRYTVTQMLVDEDGNIEKDEDGSPIVTYFEKFETEAEQKAKIKQLEAYNEDEYLITKAGIQSEEGYKELAGISPETVALFGEVVGAGKVTQKFYEQALSERSALKRRLNRKGTAGFSYDVQRVLANMLTSNARFAAQRFYLMDLNNAVRFIPQEAGDVKDEAIRLKDFIQNPKDNGAGASSLAFLWYIAGSVASAVVNLTQTLTMTAPYLSQWGPIDSQKELAKAVPFAMGMKEMGADLRRDLKQASQEGIVDAQEIFHLYSTGAKSVTTRLSKASDKARARVEGFATLMGAMFSAAEKLNRRLAFIAAWNLAKSKGMADPYAFAVRAVNETQGIYNKVNRPNLGRSTAGRMILTFKQFSIMYIELMTRMWKHGGPEGKRAVLFMLAMLTLVAGIEGLPGEQDIEDVITSVLQAIGYNFSAKEFKRRHAHELLGKEWGDMALYGISSRLPLDFSGRLGLGNLIPGTGLFAPSEESRRAKEISEVLGPVAGMVGQVFDAYDAAVEKGMGKALQNLLPKAGRDLASAIEWASEGKATDYKGRPASDVSAGEIVLKGIGFNPTVMAQKYRREAPAFQVSNFHKRKEEAFTHAIARAKTPEESKAAWDDLEAYNKRNPGREIVISRNQVRGIIRDMATPPEVRGRRRIPKELRGELGPGLDSVTDE